MNSETIYKARADWESFIATLSENERQELGNYQESIDCNNLLSCVALDNKQEFDIIVNRLPSRYLYDEELLPFIYQFYLKRDLHEMAYDYVIAAEEYFKIAKTSTPVEIQQIFDTAVTRNLLNKYRSNLERIPGLAPDNIPKIVPDSLNNKRNLNLFILNEFIQAARVLCEKIEGIKQITHENRYNDLFVATLRLRFPFWGWSLHDQSRLSTSMAGLDAGSVDIAIQDRGAKNFAVFEAFILRDKAYTEKHILKVKKYVSSIDRFYIIIYHLNPSANFESDWDKYKSDVLAIAYPTNLTIDSTNGFTDLVSEFSDVSNFKIAKTNHGNQIEMFHLMIDIDC